MNFEVQNALLGLDSHTPDFFITEALREWTPKAKESLAKTLRTLGDQPDAARHLRAILSLY